MGTVATPLQEVVSIFAVHIPTTSAARHLETGWIQDALTDSRQGRAQVLGNQAQSWVS